jgi:hypothetical protein
VGCSAIVNFLLFIQDFMNKKLVQHGVFVLLISFSAPSFSMYNAIVRCAQMAGAGYCIYDSWKPAYEWYKVIEEKPSGDPVSDIVQQWAQNEMKKLKMSDEHIASVGLFCRTDYRDDWATANDKAIFISHLDEKYLREALEKKQEQGIEKGESDECDLTIADCAMKLKYSLHGIITKSFHRYVHSLVWIPLLVEATSFVALYGLSKLCKIKSPTTVLDTLFRLSLVGTGVIAKLFFNPIGSEVLYKRYNVKKADIFACEHASGRLELEVHYEEVKFAAEYFEKDLLHSPHVYDWCCDDEKKIALLRISYCLNNINVRLAEAISKNSKKQILLKIQKNFYMRLANSLLTPGHPYLFDRVVLAKKYLDKWDAEHKNAVRQ